MPSGYESLFYGFGFSTLVFLGMLFYMRYERKQIDGRQQAAARQLKFAFQPDGTPEKDRAPQPSARHR